MKNLGLAVLAFGISHGGFSEVESKLTPFDSDIDAEVIVLQNDSFVDAGGQAYLQLGFVTGEKAGIWAVVPDDISHFKVDYFRVLIGNSSTVKDLKPSFVNTQVFFQMGISKTSPVNIPAQIENAAQVTPGPYWNDIPAQGAAGSLPCAGPGDLIGAALEFTHTGAPSVYRDIDGLQEVKYNTLFAIPGGWNYSVVFGLRGDWILRIVGHAADPSEC
jgi:hypothetical protein